jgi:hypothetical protein
MAQFTHGVTHWDPDNCYGCSLKTKTFAPSIFTTTPGGAKAASNNKREHELVQDLAAFKRMRQQGLQPRATRGAARIESEAESTFEVASGQLAHKKAKGKDAGKPISKRGKEWRKRAEEAHTAIQRGEVVS